MKKDIQFPSYPDEWKFMTLRSINNHRSNSIVPNRFSNELFEYYSIPAYQENRIPSQTLGNEIESAKLVFDIDTVIFGKLNPRVEKVWIVRDHYNCRKIGSTEWIPIKPIEKVNVDYLYFLLWSEHVMPKAKTLVSGSTPSRQRVDPKAFYQIIVPIPPLSEQYRIAHILSTVQTAIEQQERLIALTRELKAALMHKLFTEGLRGEPLKETEIGPMPESWVISTIGKEATLQTGGTPSRDNPEYWRGTIPWVKTGEINYSVIKDTEEYITEAGLKNSSTRVYPKGTLLVAMYGQGVTRGRVGILGIDACSNQACASITPLDECVITTWYIYYFLQYQYNQLRELGHGANQRNLNLDLIRGFPIYYPLIQEQNEIINILKVFDKHEEIILQKKDLLGDLFSTLLHQLMTGQIRVNDLELPGFEDQGF